MHKHLSYDGHGINDTDAYRSRLLTFADGVYDEDRAKLGPVFAAAPDLLAALVDLVNRCDTTTLPDGSSLDTLAACAAIARAEGRAFDGDSE